MQTWTTILGASASVFGVIGVGALLRRVQIWRSEGDDTLFKLVIFVMVPCLFIDVVVGNPSLKQAQNVWAPPLVGFLSVVVGCVIALMAARLLGPMIGLNDPRSRRTFAVCVGIFNYGYIPYPLVQQVFEGDVADRTLGVLVVHNVGVELAIWTVGVLLLSGKLGRDLPKRILNPPLIAIVIALTCNAVGVPRDHAALAPLFSAIHLVGQAAIPMGLLLVGAALGDQFHIKLFVGGMKATASAAVLRLAVLPALALGVIYLWQGASDELKRVMVVEAAMPAAAFPVVLARVYGGDTVVALRVMIATSVISLITIPIWLQFGLKLVGLGG